jgi:hypothetical protein
MIENILIIIVYYSLSFTNTLILSFELSNYFSQPQIVSCRTEQSSMNPYIRKRVVAKQEHCLYILIAKIESTSRSEDVWVMW